MPSWLSGASPLYSFLYAFPPTGIPRGIGDALGAGLIIQPV